MAAGAFTPLFLVRLVLNRPVEPCIGMFIDNYTMLRFTDEIFVDEAKADRIEKIL